jgi:hypothetical protein
MLSARAMAIAAVESELAEIEAANAAIAAGLAHRTVRRQTGPEGLADPNGWLRED